MSLFDDFAENIERILLNGEKIDEFPACFCEESGIGYGPYFTTKYSRFNVMDVFRRTNGQTIQTTSVSLVRTPKDDKYYLCQYRPFELMN